MQVLFTQQNEDEKLCQNKFDFAISKNLSSLPLNEIIVEVGKSFIGTNYVANILDESSEEKLIVNMRALDCVSFYENALALARVIKKEKYTFQNYLDELQLIRYRGGVIDGYASRLHYTTDYFFDNDKRNILMVVTDKIIEKKYLSEIPTPINFMSSHSSSYKQLSDSINQSKIIQIEKEISKRKIYFIPKKFISKAKLNHGDIVGITTNILGLDISHTGIIFKSANGVIKFLHASQKNKEVEITTESLEKYLSKNPNQTGIVVVRVK